MAAKLSSGQNLLNPNFSEKTAFDDDFLSALRARKVQDLFTASSKLPSLSPHPLTSASPGKTEGRCLFFYFKIKKKNYLLSFWAVASSCACSLWVDKAAAEATGNEIRSEAAHEYLKWIVEQREDRKGGVQWKVGGWENKSGPQYTF